MKQMMLADAEYTGKSQQTHKELFLIEMHQVLPWKGSLLELHYPESEGSRSSYSLAAILRIHLIQSSFGYDDPAMVYTFYETTILRQSAGMNTDCIPEEVIPSVLVGCWRNMGRPLISFVSSMESQIIGDYRCVKILFSMGRLIRCVVVSSGLTHKRDPKLSMHFSL